MTFKEADSLKKSVTWIKENSEKAELDELSLIMSACKELSEEDTLAYLKKRSSRYDVAIHNPKASEKAIEHAIDKQYISIVLISSIENLT